MALAEVLKHFSVSYHVGKVCQTAKDCLNYVVSLHCGQQCTAPNELLDAGLGDVPKGVSLSLGGGVNASFCIVSRGQCVKNCEGLVKLHGFHCIGGSSVPPH